MRSPILISAISETMIYFLTTHFHPRKTPGADNIFRASRGDPTLAIVYILFTFPHLTVPVHPTKNPTVNTQHQIRRFGDLEVWGDEESAAEQDRGRVGARRASPPCVAQPAAAQPTRRAQSRVERCFHRLLLECAFGRWPSICVLSCRSRRCRLTPVNK